MNYINKKRKTPNGEPETSNKQSKETSLLVIITSNDFLNELNVHTINKSMIQLKRKLNGSSGKEGKDRDLQACR